MGPFSFILTCVLASVLVGIIAGFLLGRTSQSAAADDAKAEEGTASLATIGELLKSISELTNSVGSRNSAIREVREHMGGIQATGDLEQLRQLLLGEISTLLESNQRLEDDLEYANCRLEAQAEELDRTRIEARIDSLTRVANRKAFDSKLKLLLGNCKRYGESFALILADLDHFKWINDTHGHLGGDRVLKELGGLLSEHVREGDFVARYGGDEFAVLLPHTDLKAALNVAERLRSVAAGGHFDFVDEEDQSAITLSLGVAAVGPDDSPESIVARADQALYRSKDAGRNRVARQEGPAFGDEPGVAPLVRPAEADLDEASLSVAETD